MMLLPLFVILYIWREKTNAGRKNRNRTLRFYTCS
ncbi:hypothetical protein RUMTOR_01274 [[Ruminococcus] torques ATCC 27756]|uniref:Uncharacterized protein n=1 Tax=[Ruminococcus] torques ATCC 27756 TaxID=411460 RepID=A5KM18_9FIRM|nr:hypothetical protein RUMTOR_01274 [[Ruminococcus] torques ATCC 27756]